MRQLGVRIGITLVIAIVATVGVLGGTADARARRHHRHHHHATGGGGDGDGGSTPTPTAGPCVATPQTATMNLLGAFSMSVSCHGLAPFQAITFDSLLLRGNCAAVTFQGGAPPVVIGSDGAGNVSFSIAGFNCLAGTYSVQGVGSFDNIDFPVALTF